MDHAQAMEFVREHGVVLVAASGPAPKLTEAIALAALHPNVSGVRK